MNTILKNKLVFVALLAFVGAGLNLAQAQTKVVVIPLMGDDTKLEPFAPLADPSPQDSDYTRLRYSVIDKVTGLQWQRRASSTTRDWNAAWTYCQLLSLENKDDWRMPSISELTSIANYGESNPAINGLAFPSTNSYSYWSSTNSMSTAPNAWGVHFFRGDIGHYPKSESTNKYVRCVRTVRPSGPLLQDNNNGTVADLATGLTWQQRDNNLVYTWATAQNYCSDLVLANKSDWRLPNIKELASIVDYRAVRPSRDMDMFLSPYSHEFWSLTTYVGLSSYAFISHSTEGQFDSTSKTGGAFVRCVR